MWFRLFLATSSAISWAPIFTPQKITKTFFTEARKKSGVTPEGTGQGINQVENWFLVPPATFQKFSARSDGREKKPKQKTETFYFQKLSASAACSLFFIHKLMSVFWLDVEKLFEIAPIFIGNCFTLDRISIQENINVNISLQKMVFKKWHFLRFESLRKEKTKEHLNMYQQPEIKRKT